MGTTWAIHNGTKSYSIFGMVELNCMMYLININLKLIKLYLNIQIKLYVQYFLNGNILFYDTFNENKP